ncbi:MAG: hypothetical protein JNK21_08930, partial [Rhodospirillaceae bacterium]|nr:hypothetical protein [Rhodospirillaceae bacterium]
MDGQTLILTREDIAALMMPGDYMDAVAMGFIAGATGAALSPPPLHLAAQNGGRFHAKAASLHHQGRWYAA